MERIKKVLLLLFVLGSIAFGQIFPKEAILATKDIHIMVARENNFTEITPFDNSKVPSRTFAYIRACLGYAAATNINVIGWIKPANVFVVYYADAYNENIAFLSPSGSEAYIAQTGDEEKDSYYNSSFFIKPYTSFINSENEASYVLSMPEIYIVNSSKAYKLKVNKSLLNGINRDLRVGGTKQSLEQKRLEEQKVKGLELLKQTNVIYAIEDIHNYVSQFTNEYTNFTCTMWKDDDGTFAGYLIKYSGIGYISDYNKFSRGDAAKSYPATYQLNIRIYNNGNINYWIRFFDFSGKVKEVKQVWSKASGSLTVHSSSDSGEILYLSTDSYTDLLTLLLNFGIDKKYIFTPYNYEEEGYQIYNAVYNFVSSFNKKWPSIFK